MHAFTEIKSLVYFFNMVDMNDANKDEEMEKMTRIDRNILSSGAIIRII